TKEVTHGRFNTGILLVVPPGTKHQLFQIIATFSSNGEPDMGNHPGAFLIENLLGLPCLNGPAIVVSPACVVAGLFQRFIILAARVPRKKRIAFGSAAALG